MSTSPFIMSFKTPILILTFNRPKHVKKLLKTIRKLKPQNLFVSCDGPRPNNKEDILNIRLIKRIIEKDIDWICTLQTNFQVTNGGCKLGVSRGITWFFDHVEEGIILEDDCQPDSTFFRYCEELLKKYKNEERIFSIMGSNILQKSFSQDSYVYTPHMFCWGWATWRRAWQHFDLEMNEWPTMKQKNSLLDTFQDQSAVDHWTNIFDKTKNDEIDSWAYRWVYTCFKHKALNILPNVNMITNEGFGFGVNSTHTKLTHAKYSIIPKRAMKFPMKHPKKIKINKIRALFINKSVFQEPFYIYAYNLLLGTLKSYLSKFNLK